ncbi:hypothetical protein X736_31025 [Mesorhizobium sp. L2C089B000]|nr:hypothetical protein X736_31025 [Mesorhizobium sp. L2C089B000]
MIQLACGVDLIAEHIKLVIGEQWNLRKNRSHAAAARILVPDHDGTLDWIGGDTQAAAVPGIAQVKLFVKPETLIVMKGDYRDEIGHVIAVSSNLAQAAAIVQRAADLICWSITPLPTLGKQSGPRSATPSPGTT